MTKPNRPAKVTKRGRMGEKTGDAGREGEMHIGEMLRTGNVRKMFNHARNDWYFSENSFLSNLQRSIKRLDDGSGTVLLTHIRGTIGQVMTTGTLKVKFRDGDTICLPVVKRKKSRKQIMRDYVKDMKSKYKEHVGFNRFLRNFKLLTKGLLKMKTVTTIVWVCHVFENIGTLEYLLNELVMDVLEWKKLISVHTAVSGYLKHCYHTHLDVDGGAAHDTRSTFLVEFEMVYDVGEGIGCPGNARLSRSVSKSFECSELFQSSKPLYRRLLEKETMWNLYWWMPKK